MDVRCVCVCLAMITPDANMNRLRGRCGSPRNVIRRILTVLLLGLTPLSSHLLGSVTSLTPSSPFSACPSLPLPFTIIRSTSSRNIFQCQTLIITVINAAEGGGREGGSLLSSSPPQVILPQLQRPSPTHSNLQRSLLLSQILRTVSPIKLYSFTHAHTHPVPTYSLFSHSPMPTLTLHAHNTHPCSHSRTHQE